ncbi:MAG: response regulator [Anaerolineae bacterium]|nr:MAG: response regulator [Anaerolineae bacterium]
MSEARVLVVDDETGITQLCERLLARAGFEVTVRNDPAEGVKLLNERPYDLLLADIRMPGMDGFDLMEAGQKAQPELAVVIMTGFGTLETAMQALHRGVDGLILKPFEQGSDIVKSVRAALLERQRKRENARLRAVRPLLEMAETLFNENRANVLHGLILDAIQEQLASPHAGIYQRRSGEAQLRLLAGRGSNLPEDHSRADAGPVGRADHWKVPISVAVDGPGDADLQAALQAAGLGAVLCIPVERGISGGLVLLAGRDPNTAPYSLADLEWFGILARQADVALENARLYGELRANVQKIEAQQRALMQAEKMAAVGRLTASIAHEVNNPLQAVQNCLHLAGREELSEAERADYLKMAGDELDRLMTTMQRMLDYYRPGAVERKPVDVNEVLNKSLALLQKQLEEGNVKVVRELGQDLPFILAVGNQLQQVFFNLILNALEAMPKGGTLTVRTELEDAQLAVRFRDTGGGVKASEREHIFEPFVSSKEGGSGLGLSVSYGILTAHGGSLELERTQGKGACFRVGLPVGEAQ